MFPLDDVIMALSCFAVHAYMTTLTKEDVLQIHTNADIIYPLQQTNIVRKQSLSVFSKCLENDWSTMNKYPSV